MADFEKRSREVLEESAERLDGRTRSRLTQARHAALSQLEKPARNWWRFSVPAGAAAAVVLAVVSWNRAPTETGEQEPSVAEDMEILADAPDLVADGEDLEFYEWAADEVES